MILYNRELLLDYNCHIEETLTGEALVKLVDKINFIRLINVGYYNSMNCDMCIARRKQVSVMLLSIDNKYHLVMQTYSGYSASAIPLRYYKNILICSSTSYCKHQ